MSASLTLVVLMGAMYAVGIYVMLERSLTRVLIGFLLVGNATNILIFLMSGGNGSPPLVTGTEADDSMVDPVPQVLMLTAIVINFGITAFLLALIYRSWWLAQLGEEGDTLPDEHEGETEAETESSFDPLDLDDAAVQEVLRASDERPGDDESSAPGGSHRTTPNDRTHDTTGEDRG
ncbi:Na(+)/H(+) antiporter subunit C [Labedella populi]|uniref:Na(+)/H(+) antiporter subunit C n=1 Tax=Labedella populi TaxID=2498850 RepID=A0A3S4AP71_9MICO|nr:NADH-quinone oxidoreductase subunit K [Labedella populi]RWZ64438.1 Na(+)/H(+) antiporter subunit C [Labedella populi]